MSLQSGFQGKYPQFLPSHEHRNEGRNEDRNEDKNGTKSGTKKIAAESRAERVQLVLSAITDDSTITVRVLSKIWVFLENTILWILKELQENGTIKREGFARKGRWVVL